MACPSLLDLPEESIARIASYVPKRSQLLPLALTSTQLHRISAEFLYRERRIQLGRVACNHDALQSLTVRFLSRPDLAVCVRHLTIRGEWRTDWDEARFSSLAEIHPLIKSSIYKLSGDRREGRIWMNDVLLPEREEALVVLLISALPNLKIFDTDLPQRPGVHDTWLLKEVQLGNSGVLQNLRDIVLVKSSAPCNLPLEFVMPIFHLPRLRRVFLFEISITQDYHSRRKLDNSPLISGSTEPCHHRFSSVTHLETRKARLPFDKIRELIDSCQGLETFICQNDIDLEPNTIQYHDILPALLRHAPTLRNLSLHCTNVVYEEEIIYEEDPPEDNPLPLKEFDQISHLSITAEYMMGFDLYEPPIFYRAGAAEVRYQRIKGLFPANLRKLTFEYVRHYTRYPLLATLRRMIVDKSVLFQNLEEICILVHFNI